jgi:hypothetical protein
MWLCSAVVFICFFFGVFFCAFFVIYFSKVSGKFLEMIISMRPIFVRLFELIIYARFCLWGGKGNILIQRLYMTCITGPKWFIMNEEIMKELWVAGGGAFSLFRRLVISFFFVLVVVFFWLVFCDLLGIFCQTVAKGYHCPTLHLWRWFFFGCGDIQGSRNYCWCFKIDKQ